MKKRMIAGLMAVLMTMSLAACGSSAGSSDASGTGSAATGDNSAAQAASGDKVTLSLCWWGNQTRNDVTKKAVDLYMEQNPNVEIKVEFTDWSGYWDKLSAMAAGGNLPDIIQMDYSYLQQYQQSGQLADLSQFIDSGVIDTSKIADSVIDSGSIDGTCYALSLGSNAPMMVYDKEIVEQAGVELPEQLTIEELYDIGQTIYEKTGVKIIVNALQEPVRQIAKNAGVDGSVVLEKIKSSRKVGYGFDAYKEVYCDMIGAGIVDPAKVTRSALENAASVSSMVLTTEALVADKPEPPAPAAPAGMGGMDGMY